MLDLIHTKLQRLRRLLRRSLWRRGVAALIATACAAFLIAAGLDRWVVGDSPSGRVVLSLAVFGAPAIVLRRELLLPLRVAMSDSWLAGKFERRFPQLGGGLASAVEFLSGRYAREYGSPELQEQSVLAAVPGIHALEPQRLVDRRPERQRIGLAVALLAVCAGWTIFDPARVWASVQRLCLPFAEVALPRDVELQLIDPADGRVLTPSDIAQRRFPRGSTWELHVSNARGPLPPDLRVFRSGSSGTVGQESIPLTGTADATAPQAGQLRLELQESFRFRIAGGDDDTQPWIPVSVVPPPALEDLELELTFPEYTRVPARRIPEGTRYLQVVSGSTIRFRGRSDVELSAARLNGAEETLLEFETADGDFEGVLTCSAVGAQFAALELVDVDGVANTAALRLEILTIADRPPDVAFVEPATDLFLTPDAELPLRIEARDDYGLVDVRLTIGAGTPPREGAERAADTVDVLHGPTHEPASSLELQRTLRFADLGFVPGERVLLALTATDAIVDDATRPGRDEREVTLISESEKQRELAGRLKELLARIRREEAAQRRVRQQLQPGAVPDDQNDAPRIPDVVQEQQRIEQTLTDDERGVQIEFERLLAEFDLNRLNNRVLRERIVHLADELRLLERELFPSIDQLLLRLPEVPPAETSPRPVRQEFADPIDPAALGAWLESLPEPEHPAAVRDQIVSRQAEVEDVLRGMSGMLSEWETHQDLKEQLSGLVERQSELTTETGRLKTQTLGKTRPELTDLELRQIDQLRERHLRQQQEFGRFREELVRRAGEEQTPPAIRDLEGLVAESTAASELSELGRQLHDNRLSEAEKISASLAEEFGAWDDQLNDRSITDIELRRKFLEEQQGQLGAVREAQRQVANDAVESDRREQLREQGDGLSQREQDVRERVERIERAVQRLELPESREALREAANALRAAEERLDRPELPREEFDEIERRLDRVEQQFARDAAALEQQQLQEQVAELLPLLRKLRDEQQALRADSEALATRQVAAGKWNLLLLRELNDLNKRQAALHVRLAESTAPLQSIEAVEFALAGIGREMQQSQQSLAARDLRASIDVRQSQVVQRLTILIDVLSRKPDGEETTAAGEQTPGASPDDRNDEESPRDIGLELTVLRAVQEQIHERMRTLSRAATDPDAPPSLKTEWTALENEQARVLDLLNELLRSQGVPIP